MAGSRGGRVRIYLDVDTRQLEAGLKRADRAMVGLDRSAQRSSGVLDRFSRSNTTLGGTFKDAAKGAALAASAYIGIAQARDAIDTTTDLAKATIGLNANLKLSVKTGSELSAVAKSRNVDTRTLTMFTKTLSTQIEAARAGTESSVKAFRDLGISQKQLASGGGDKILFDIADGAKALGDGTERTAAMSKLFGRSFATLGPVFREGAGAMKEQMKVADEMGASFGGKNLGQLKDMIKEQRRAKLATIGLQVAFSEELAPALTKGMRTFGDIVGSIRKVPGPIRDIFNPIGKFINLMGDAKNKATGIWPDITGAWSGGVSAIKGFVNDIIGVINMIPGVDIDEIGGGGVAIDKSRGSGGRGRGRKNTTKVGKRARGGFIDRPQIIVGEEAPTHPEYVVATNPAYRERNVGLWMNAGKDLGIPGFALGGVTNAIGDFAGKTPVGKLVGGASDLLGKLPSPGGLPGMFQGTGRYAVAKAGAYIKSKASAFTKSSGGGYDAALQGAGKNIGSMLLGNESWVDSHTLAIANWLSSKFGVPITSTYRSPAANAAAGGVPGSHHTRGSMANPGAVDFGTSQGLLSFATKNIAGLEEAMIHDAGSGLHTHIAFFRKGGVMNPVEGRGARFIQGGGNWSADEAATLVYQAGGTPAEAKLLSTKVQGESGGRPGAVGHDPGGTTGLGLWQITTGFNDDLIQRFGGRSGIMNPVNNAKAALAILRRQGIGAWYAPSSAPGEILFDKIKGTASASTKPTGEFAAGHGLSAIYGKSSSKQGKRGLKRTLSGSLTRKSKKGVDHSAGIDPSAVAPDTADLNANLEEMNALLTQQIANQQAALNVSQSQYGVLARAIADVASGAIGGAVGMGFQSPSYAGGLARY